jgi:hypothetical protein
MLALDTAQLTAPLHALGCVLSMRLTHIGTATLLVEVKGLRILTDPANVPVVLTTKAAAKRRGRGR